LGGTRCVQSKFRAKLRIKEHQLFEEAELEAVVSPLTGFTKASKVVGTEQIEAVKNFQETREPCPWLMKRSLRKRVTQMMP
jgi:hypothetical protein